MLISITLSRRSNIINGCSSLSASRSPEVVQIKGACKAKRKDGTETFPKISNLKKLDLELLMSTAFGHKQNRGKLKQSVL